MLESQIENRTDIPDPKGARVSKPFWVMPTMRILGLVSLVASFYFPLAILPAVFFLAKDFQEGLSRARELWIKRERFLAVGVFLTTFLPASLVITVFFSLLFQFSPLLNLPLLAIAAGVFIISSNLVRGLFLLQSNEWRKYGGFGENDELSWKNLILLSFALVFGLGSLKQASAPKKRAFIGLGALAVLMAISGSVSLILYAITVFTSANLSFLVGIGTTLGLSGPLAIAMPVILTGIVLGFIIGAIAAIVWDASIKKQPSIQQNARKEYDQSPSSKQESEDQRIFALLDNKDPLQKEELEKILNLFKEKPIYFQTVHFFPEGRGRKLFLKVIETRDREALSFLLNNFLGAKENYTVREQTLCKFLMEQLFTAEKEGKSDVSDFLFEWFNKKCGNSGKNIMWDNVLLRMDKKKPYIIQLLLRHPDIQPPSDTVHGRTSEYLIPALIHAVASNQKDFAQYLVEKCAVDIEAAIKQVPNEELLVVTRLRYLAKNLKSQQPNVVAAGHPAAASPEQSHLPPFSSDEKLERLVGATHGAQKLGLSKPSQSQPSKQRSTNEDVKYPQNTNQQPLHHSAYNSHQSQRSSQLLAYKPVSFSNSALPKTDSKNEEDHQNKKTNPKPVVPKTDDEVILDLLKKESPLEKEELEKILELLKAEPAYLRSMNLYPEGRKLLAKVIEIQDKSVLDFLLKGLPLKQNYMVGEERTYVFLANELFSAEKTGRYDISDTLLTWFSKCREVGKDIMWKKAILRMNHGQLHITKLLLRHPHIQPPLKYRPIGQYLIPALIQAVASNEYEIAKYLIEKCGVDVKAAIESVSNKNYLSNIPVEQQNSALAENIRKFAEGLSGQSVALANHSAEATSAAVNAAEQQPVFSYISSNKQPDIVDAANEAEQTSAPESNQPQLVVKESENKSLKRPDGRAWKSWSFHSMFSLLRSTAANSKNKEDMPKSSEQKNENGEGAQNKNEEKELILGLLKKQGLLAQNEVKQILEILKKQPHYFNELREYIFHKREALFKETTRNTLDIEMLDLLLAHIFPLLGKYDQKDIYDFLADELFFAEKMIGRASIADHLLTWFHNKANNAGKNIMWERAFFWMDSRHTYVINCLSRHPDIQPPKNTTTYGPTREYLVPTLICTIAWGESDKAQYLIEKCGVDVEAAIEIASGKKYASDIPHNVHQQFPALAEKIRQFAKQLQNQQPDSADPANHLAEAAPLAVNAEQQPVPPSDEKLEVVGAVNKAGEPASEQKDPAPRESGLFGGWGQNGESPSGVSVPKQVESAGNPNSMEGPEGQKVEDSNLKQTLPNQT